MTREDAYKLLTEFTKNKNLIKHALAVEAAMGAYAKKYGEDEEKWRVVGLLHDFDYEIHPTAEEHPAKGADILRERGYSEEIIRAVLSHANHMELTRETLLEKTLYAVDELTGFITAVALAVLALSIRQGLLGLPEMQIAGNGSTAGLLLWYQDRAGSVLPQQWVASVPLLVYRLAMLAWALWLALALVRWLRWGWGCFSTVELWRPLRRGHAPMGAPPPS